MRIAGRFEAARAADPAMKEAETGELMRLVPGKRAIVEGRFGDARAIFRVHLGPCDDTARREWAELSRLWPLMRSGPHRVARPLHFSEANGIIVVERVTGTPLMDHLSKMPDGGAGIWPGVARWLRHATESTETWRPARHEGWLNRARRAAAAQPFAELRKLETGILEEITRIGAQLSGRDWRVAICHGDYHPNNLILDGDSLTAIDTGGSAHLPIYKDMARFLVHLARRGILPSGRTRFGVDAAGFDSFAAAFDLARCEKTLMLPFMIGCETLLRVETRGLSRDRVRHARAMSRSLLEELRTVAPS